MIKCEVCKNEIKYDENAIVRWDYKRDNTLLNNPDTLQVVHQGKCDQLTNYNYPASIVIDDLCHCVYALKYILSMPESKNGKQSIDTVEKITRIAFRYMLNDKVGNSENIKMLLSL